VLCFDASRLARNGRDWHHLLELCGLVEARVIDLDGLNKISVKRGTATLGTAVRMLWVYHRISQERAAYWAAVARVQVARAAPDG
jgi:hypothetical protein